MSEDTPQDTKITEEMRKLYSSTLKNILDNINYYISKKNKFYQELLEKTKNYLDNFDKKTRDFPLNADKYFILIYKSLIIENYKLAKNIFPGLKILIKNNFLIGKTELNELRIDLEDINDNNIFKNGKIIDLIIQSFTSIDLKFEDDDIWLFSSDCLNEIVKNKNMMYNIKGNMFFKIYEYYFRIFSKLEKDKDKIKDIKEKISFLINNTIEELNAYLNFSSPLISSDPNNKNYLFEIYKKLGTTECIENYKNNNYHPYDILVCREVKFIVDTICIREARGELQEIKNMNNGKNLIPIIPKNSDEINLIKKLTHLNIYNEYSYKCGFFGWCYVCRKTSNFYSMDLRLPVCFFNCKDILLKEESQYKKIRNNLVKDYPYMFNYFCKILTEQKETSKALKIYI